MIGALAHPGHARARRVIALGASNLTRGFSTVVATAREIWGEPLEVFGALGHGRSYGMESAIPFRSLPGILESGLWSQLASLPRVPTRALLTDVGNDILYGAPPPRILAWVRECLDRLGGLGSEVILTDLPLSSIGKLGRARFAIFRTVLVPSCRLSLREVSERAAEVNEGIVSLAREGGHALVRLKPEWYGFDPIHVRPRYWRVAWREILLAGQPAPPVAPAGSAGRSPSAWRLYWAPPDRSRILGAERRRAQPAVGIPGRTSVWLY